MSLRQALGPEADRLHDLLDELLDRDDAMVLLFDGRRAVNYIEGFGLSPCQRELVALDIERVVRGTGAAGTPVKQGRRSERDRPRPGHRSCDAAGSRRVGAGAVLRLAPAIDTPGSA